MYMFTCLSKWFNLVHSPPIFAIPAILFYHAILYAMPCFSSFFQTKKFWKFVSAVKIWSTSFNPKGAESDFWQHARAAAGPRSLSVNYRRTPAWIIIKINTQLLYVIHYSYFTQNPFITTQLTAILISVLEPPNRELRISTVGEPLLGLSSKQSCSTALTTRRSNFIIPKDLSEGEFYFNVHVPVSLKTGKILLIPLF